MAMPKLDIGAVYQFKPWIAIYTQLENGTSNQHIGPIGIHRFRLVTARDCGLRWGKK